MRRKPMISALAAVIAVLVPIAAHAASDHATYTYDPYDPSYRLIQVTYDNGTTIYYIYDTEGNRQVYEVTGSASPLVRPGVKAASPAIKGAQLPKPVAAPTPTKSKAPIVVPEQKGSANGTK